MDVTEIKKLMGILEDTDLTEISLESEGTKVLLKKDKTVKRAAAPVAPAAPAAAPAVSEEKKTNVSDLISLNIGRFYLNSKLAVGSQVEEGAVVGHIESIGVKTDVKSDKTGKIVEIYVQNGGIVQFGQPIMAIEIK